MGADWLPEADRDGRSWTCNSMYKNTSAKRAVMHWTASSRNASPKSQADYMWNSSGGSTGYHLIVPIDDNGYRPLQLRAASCAAGSLYNSGQLARSPNREGSVNIQVSMVCTTGDDPFVKGPGPWWGAVLAWLDGWGIPRQFVAGDWNANAVMSTSSWYSSTGGYTAHKQVPEVPGTVRKPDPGPVAAEVLWAGTTPPPQPQPEPPPSDVPVTLTVVEGGTVSLRQIRKGSEGRDVREVQAMLSEWAIDPGPHDGIFGSGTDNAVRQFQSSRGLASDGIVGANTYQSLFGR